MAVLATERIVTLVTPEEKKAFEAKAKKLNSSVGDLVRRSVKAYDPNVLDESEAFEILLQALERSNKEAAAALDNAERKLDRLLAYFAEKGNR